MNDKAAMATQRLLSVELTGSQMRRLCPGAAVLPYSDLVNVQSAAQLLDNPAHAAVVLYATSATPTTVTGHWTCCWQQDGKLHWFDPYGFSVDAEFAVIPAAQRAQLGEAAPRLSQLLHGSGLPVVADTAAVQAWSPSVDTCGRHCAVRLWHRDMSPRQYSGWIHAQAARRGMTPDQLVVQLTQPVLTGRR